MPKLAGERFWSKVDGTAEGQCWNWIGGKDRKGYGRFYTGGRQTMAHRWSYESVRGDVPVGLVIDHLCRVHACVNPSHLEPVTNAENIRRGLAGPRAVNNLALGRLKGRAHSPNSGRKKGSHVSHCKNGHPVSGENLQLIHSRGGSVRRKCRTCNRTSSRDYFQRLKAASQR